MMIRKVILPAIAAVLLLGAGGYLLFRRPPAAGLSRFDGARAFRDVETQVAFGPRIPGSTGHARTVDWILGELDDAGWQTRVQETQAMGHPVRNIVGARGSGTPALILAAHYDTRLYADNDPEPANQRRPGPGANDGASGVAVLLELARTLPPSPRTVWLVFLDAEDNGRIEGWDWILGSRAFVGSLDSHPSAMVLLDMIGDSDLNIYEEYNSDPGLTASIWGQAAALGFGAQFIPQQKYQVLDDHVPFIEAGIPSVDLIDLDYPYWHTLADTPDKVSAQSLQAVGETLQVWVPAYLKTAGPAQP